MTDEVICFILKMPVRGVNISGENFLSDPEIEP